MLQIQKCCYALASALIIIIIIIYSMYWDIRKGNGIQKSRFIFFKNGNKLCCCWWPSTCTWSRKMGWAGNSVVGWRCWLLTGCVIWCYNSSNSCTTTVTSPLDVNILVWHMSSRHWLASIFWFFIDGLQHFINPSVIHICSIIHTRAPWTSAAKERCGGGWYTAWMYFSGKVKLCWWIGKQHLVYSAQRRECYATQLIAMMMCLYIWQNVLQCTF